MHGGSFFSFVRDITRLKQIEKAHQKSEELYKNIVESQTDFIDRYLPGGILTYVNHTLVKYSGVKAEKLIGNSFYQFIHEEDREKSITLIESINCDNPVVTFESRIVLPNGKICWHSWTHTGFFDDCGTIIEYQSVGIDITERKAAENALKENKERYRAMIEAFNGYVYICSNDHHIEFMNDKLIKRTGRDATGEYCYKALHQLEAICEWCVNRKILSGETICWEIKSPKDGCWYEVCNSPIYNPDGTISKQAMITDITERKTVEENLKMSEEKFRTLFDHSQDAVFITIPDGSILNANPAACNMFGMTELEICELGRDGILDSTDPRLLPSLEDRSRSGQIFTELTFIRKSGEKFPAEVSSVITSNEPQQSFVIVRDITERKLAEKALKDSEHLFRTLVAASSQSVWSFRPRGLSQVEQIDWANASWWCEFTGQTETQRIANDVTGWLDAVHSEDREVARSNWLNIFAASKPTAAEFRVLHRDGNWRWLKVRGVPIKDDQGAVVEIAGTVIDISERKEVEASLQKLSSEMNRLLETSATGLTRCSRDLKYLSANTAYAKLAGVPREHIIGKPIVEVMGEEGLAAIMPYVERALLGERVEYETPVPFQGSGGRFLHVVYTPDEDEHGDIVGWVASITNITKRKQAEIALRETEYELEQAQLLAGTGSWTYDPAIMKSVWSKGMYRIWGLDPSLGLFPVVDHKKYIHADDYPIFETVLKEAVENGKPYNMELRIIRPDGNERTIITICEPQCDASGKVLKLRGSNQDITERKHLEKERQELEHQLVHSQRLESLGVLAGGIAHDFNNILAIII